MSDLVEQVIDALGDNYKAPDALEIPEEEDPMTFVASQNGSEPVKVTAFSGGLPEGWAPVSDFEEDFGDEQE